MSLLDKLFGKAVKSEPPARDETVFKLLNGYRPVFHSWGGEIYETELVRAAIDAKARHISKLDITYNGTAKPSLQAKLKLGPNEWQTWGQFLYRAETLLEVQNTLLILPVIDNSGETTGIYAVYHKDIELVEYKGEPWVRVRFHNGQRVAIELRRVGIMTRYQYKNDFFGESNRALHPTMELVHMQTEGIEEGVKSAATFRFMATMNNFASDEDLAKERKRFSELNFRADDAGDFLLWPNTYKDIKQIESKPFVVDAEQMALINKNVYDYFGVNEDILQNKAIGDKWAAFYEGAIEPFAIQFSDVVTKMLFTERERQLGASIMATSNRLQYMSTNDKLNVSAQMADRGLMTRNEIRQIWNLAPLPAEIGDTLPIRGEYYNLGEDTAEPVTEEQEANADA